MFDRLRKAWGRASDHPAQAAPTDPFAGWAAGQGYAVTGHLAAQFSLRGEFNGRPWRADRLPPGRPFITGAELRARADLDLHQELAVMVLNRPLKEALEQQAYANYTESLQTTVDAGQTEELRWLAMFDEVVWDGASDAFWSCFAVLADRREDAALWLDDALAGLLLGWPEDVPGAETPFTMMLLRGKLYLRMEFQQPDLPTLAHAVTVLRMACERALALARA